MSAKFQSSLFTAVSNNLRFNEMPISVTEIADIKEHKNLDLDGSSRIEQRDEGSKKKKEHEHQRRNLYFINKSGQDCLSAGQST